MIQSNLIMTYGLTDEQITKVQANIPVKLVGYRIIKTSYWIKERWSWISIVLFYTANCTKTKERNYKILTFIIKEVSI